jgi:ABC-type transporter Mla subunit MlaD
MGNRTMTSLEQIRTALEVLDARLSEINNTIIHASDRLKRVDDMFSDARATGRAKAKDTTAAWRKEWRKEWR